MDALEAGEIKRHKKKMKEKQKEWVVNIKCILTWFLELLENVIKSVRHIIVDSDRY